MYLSVFSLSNKIKSMFNLFFGKLFNIEKVLVLLQNNIQEILSFVILSQFGKSIHLNVYDIRQYELIMAYFSCNAYLHNYFNLHVCLSLRWRRRHRRRHVPLSSFKFLQAYDKVSLIKVVWYVLRVKNIHSWSSPDPLGP